jgi:plasmid stabilization system protein ParE
MKNGLAWLAFGLLASCGLAVGAAEWKVGIARTEITPRQPVWMAGYAARKHPSEGTVHPLWAKALVVEDARGERAVIVTSDLIGSVRELSDAIGDGVQQRTGIPRERIVLNASHTHCGPVVLGCADIAHHMEAEDVARAAAYRDELQHKVIRLIEEACAGVQPANLAFGEGTAPFATNRRKIQSQKYVIGPNPQGPVDRRVPVLRVTDENDRPLAVLFGYACHNTTLGGDFYRFNGDYAGFAQVELEAEHPGVTAMFMAGCGADANPQPRGKLEHAQQHGKELAEAVDRVLAGEMCRVRGPLAVAMDRVDLPFVDPPSKRDLEARRGEGNVYQQRLTELLLKRIDERGQVDTCYPYPVQVVRFGRDLALVALAGEVVVDYPIRLHQELDVEHLWVAGYTNEVFAYVPSERILSEGGYEGGGAMVYFGWHGPFRPGVEDRVVGLVETLMDRTAKAVR